MSILDKIPSLVGNELFQKLAAIEDITALSKEDREKYDESIKVMRPGASFEFEWSTLRKAYGQKALNMEIIQTDGYYNVFPYSIQEVTYNYLGTQTLPKENNKK